MSRMRGLALCALLAGCYFQSGQAAGDAAGSSGSDGPGDIMIDAPSRLVDRGLVVRYLIAEAGSGNAPAALVDAASDPLDLPITYTPMLAYTTDSGHRGLAWTNPMADDGRADIAVAGTKIAQQLAGRTQWTIEAVYDVEAIGPGIDARIVTISTGSTGYGTATLLTSDRSHVTVEINGVGTAWPVDETQGRIVVHAVVNTNASSAGQRVQVYVAGAPMINGGGMPPNQGAGLGLAATDHLTVGNINTGGRSFKGKLYYAAFYNVALSQAEVVDNAAALAADDDHP
jgi:hypothetical protein